jgi:hypothetical protein
MLCPRIDLELAFPFFTGFTAPAFSGSAITGVIDLAYPPLCVSVSRSAVRCSVTSLLFPPGSAYEHIVSAIADDVVAARVAVNGVIAATNVEGIVTASAIHAAGDRASGKGVRRRGRTKDGMGVACSPIARSRAREDQRTHRGQ